MPPEEKKEKLLDKCKNNRKQNRDRNFNSLATLNIELSKDVVDNYRLNRY